MNRARVERGRGRASARRFRRRRTPYLLGIQDNVTWTRVQ